MSADFARLGLRPDALPRRKIDFQEGDVGEGRGAVTEDEPAPLDEWIVLEESGYESGGSGKGVAIVGTGLVQKQN